ncbi:MAG: nucleoside hydrolase [Chloroflexi bacterium OHK40]
MSKRVIFDTDIGTDVDDCLALALILASPELRLEAVTCVYGDVRLRARIAQKLLSLAGRDEVPIYFGAERPLLGLQPVYWAGHEGVGILADDDPPLRVQSQPAAAYLVEAARANPGQLHLLAVGPLTNLALALRMEPELPTLLASLTIMGGAVRGHNQLHLAFAEHNLRCDPEAAHVVFSSQASPTLVPLDVTTLVQIDRAGEQRIRAGGTAWHQAVAEQVALYPRFAQSGKTYLHDPLAAALLVDPSLVEVTPLHLVVELQGCLAGAILAHTPDAQHPANAMVALKVDRARFEPWFVERIATCVMPGGLRAG